MNPAEFTLSHRSHKESALAHLEVGRVTKIIIRFRTRRPANRGREDLVRICARFRGPFPDLVDNATAHEIFTPAGRADWLREMVHASASARTEPILPDFPDLGVALNFHSVRTSARLAAFAVARVPVLSILHGRPKR